MIRFVKRTIGAVINKLGYAIIHLPEKELDAQDRYILSRVRPYTMTSAERVIALIEATKYITRCGIPGVFVECGVWRGGSMMAVALTLLARGDTTRDLYLFDTFEGMTEPTDKDRDRTGKDARKILAKTKKNTGIWCYATLEDVQEALYSTGYPREKIHFVKGKVEETLPLDELSKIALLRLDSDWYESTYHELTHLFPLVVPAGILIIDDFGDWQGAREATEQYFSENEQFHILLNRIDRTGRIAVKLNDEMEPGPDSNPKENCNRAGIG